MRTMARWMFVVLAWTLLLSLGACVAIMLPLNLLLVPCWFAMASSVGPLAQRVFGDPRSTARRAGRRAGPSHERAVERRLVRET